MTIEGGGLYWERPADAIGRVGPWLRGRRPARRSGPTRVFMATTGCFVGDDEMRRDGAFFHVWAEDVAWQFSLRDWQGRRPPFWALRRTRRWRAEYALLAEDQHRIAQRARFYGVSD